MVLALRLNSDFSRKHTKELCSRARLGGLLILAEERQITTVQFSAGEKQAFEERGHWVKEEGGFSVLGKRTKSDHVGTKLWGRTEKNWGRNNLCS